MSDFAAHIRAVKDHIRARIIRAELLEGHRLDARELRQSTGSSVRVVRQALTELASEGILRRRQRLGTFVAGGVAQAGIAPLPAIRSVAVLSSLTQEQLTYASFTVDVLEGMRFALAQPARIEFCVPPPGAAKSIDVLPTVEAEVLRSLVQGVVALEANHSGRLNELTRAGLPVLALDFSPHDAAFDSVYVDHEASGFQSTAHLLALGHRRVAYIGERCNPHSSDPGWQERMTGYLRAMAWAGGETPQPLILGGPRDTSKLPRFLPEFHRQHRPTAYVLAASGWATDVLRVLETMGISCPRDISLACADATRPNAGALALSYARADYEEAGRLAIHLMASRILCRAMPAVRIKLPITFIPGDSSRVLQTA